MVSISRTSVARTALRLPFSSTSSAIASSSRLRLPAYPRFNSTIATSSSSSSTAESEPVASEPIPVKHSYFVPRVGKALDSLPVYTDVRNGGTRIMTEVRKIQGSVQDLKTDLSIFLSEMYATSDPVLTNQDSPLKVNKKPLRPRAGRKMLQKTANPTYLDPVQPAKVQQSGKLKIRGNRVQELKAFLLSRGF